MATNKTDIVINTQGYTSPCKTCVNYPGNVVCRIGCPHLERYRDTHKDIDTTLDLRSYYASYNL